ncbi:MAG: hypothetical protein ACRD4D_10465 [Candidatus Acidiferrales bacterium]
MLLSVSLVFGMLIAWLAVTLVFIILCIYRAVISLKEEDVLYIDPGEAKLLQEQKEVNARIDRLRPILTGTLVLVIVLGLATFGLWVYQQLS